jgi:ligand-binding SRPBCC domain-containing protein
MERQLFSLKEFMFVITRRIQVNAPIDEVWDFFSKPSNLSKITPKEMNFEIVTGSAKETYSGQIICYKVSLLPLVRVKWVTLISECIEKSFFVDEQKFGPYRFWHHQHHFKDLGNGKTEMTDIVHYKLPLLPFSSLMNKLFISKKLNQIFDYRTKVVSEVFGTEEP